MQRGSSTRAVRSLSLLAITCLALLLARPAPAQPAPAAGAPRGAAREILRQALADLPSAAVPTGILHDRVLPMADLPAHDGSDGAPPVTAAAWRQMLHELSAASLRPPAWPDVAAVREEARSARAAGVVPIALLDLAYDRLRPEALERGLLSWRDGRLVASAGVDPRALSRTARVFAAAALVEMTHHGARVAFVVPSGLLVRDGDGRAGELALDLADGRGLRPVRPDERVVASYDRPGRKLIRLRSTRPDGRVLSTSFFLDVAALAAPLPDETWPLSASIPYDGAAATGEAFVYLAEGHTAPVDPVVVVEGFDLDNTMGWDELYALLNREDLLETLRTEGYDAVVLNFTESTEPIQRNAFLLVELLQQVQAAMPAEADLVVIGASMGGLVARYALAWMETEGLDHRARSFISFDAPQGGADIPLGVQYWLAFFQGESTDAAYLLSRLDTPAARQMLLYHHTSPPGATGESDPLRAGFLADLAAAGGWPAEPRRVAVANGSGTAQDQGFAPGDQLILWEYSSLLVDITGNVWAVPDGTSRLIFDGEIDLIWPLPDTRQAVTVAGTLPWDGAPGGYRGSLAQMDSTAAPYGDIIALYDDHCFIPTVSALALDATDPFFDIAGAGDLLFLTPFDAVYYPAANQEHVLVTPENKAWFMAEIGRAVTAVETEPAPAAPVAALLGNHPNPFNPATTVDFRLAAPAEIRLGIYDARGRLVRTLCAGALPAGRHAAAWDGRDGAGREVASGVYYGRLEAGKHRVTRPLTLVR